MKLLNCEAVNFGSYASFSFDFNKLGLSLVYGSTGSGKSTILDIPCWILYGVTAKDGNADDIKSWKADNEPTRGSIEVELNDSRTIVVTRVRGKPSQNDLYWLEEGQNEPTRGKDILDTQKCLEERLGVSKEVYLTGAYFHEFSATGAFFTAKAKERRELFERISNLSLPVRISEAATKTKKIVKEALADTKNKISKEEGRLEQLWSSLNRLEASSINWEQQKDLDINELKVRHKNFELEKTSSIEALQMKANRFDTIKNEKLEACLEESEKLHNRLTDFPLGIGVLKADTLSHIESFKKEKCKECGGPKSSKEIEKAYDSLRKLEKQEIEIKNLQKKLLDVKDRAIEINEEINPFLDQLEQARKRENHYFEQIEKLKQEKNPFTPQMEETKEIINKIEGAITSAKELLKETELKHTNLCLLYDLSFQLRGELLKKSVREIQDETNRYLETYFDSEIKVEFKLEDADNLEVAIQKSGYYCNYRQLSKGQRGLLKLAFSVAVMKSAANTAGTHFPVLMFDEALDGLDSNLKVKAFSLFEELEKNHDSILLIDHASEFQNLFHKRYHVESISDNSEITLEE